MRSLFITAVFLALIGMGFSAGFVFVLGYVWVDIFTPQLVAYSILPSVPVSLIMGALSFVAFLGLKDKFEVPLRFATVLTALFAIWMTLSLLWAAAPESAFDKWNWAIKNLLFSCLIPYFLRNRFQVEAFVWTVVISGMAHCLTFGAKVAISGGGYSMSLGLVSGNTGFGEGSTLAMFSVLLIPLCLYLYKWQTLIPNVRLAKLLLTGFIVAGILTSVGTFARTGLVCLGVLSLLLVLQSKNRIRILLSVVFLSVIGYQFAGEGWFNRMSTINDGTEESAMGRVAVWKWTLEYVSEHPWGGSFDMYRINDKAMQLEDGSVLQVRGKAFHSIYFETLGEGGWIGFALFALLILVTRRSFLMAKKNSLDGGVNWISGLGGYLLFSLYVFLAGGAFIGVAFQPVFYYLVALSVAVLNLHEQSMGRGRWRSAL